MTEPNGTDPAEAATLADEEPAATPDQDDADGPDAVEGHVVNDGL